MVQIMDAPPPANILVDLPVDLVECLTADLSLADKNAMRVLSRRSRETMNSTVTKLCLCTNDLVHIQAPQSTHQVPLLARFPRVMHLTLKDAAQASLTDDLLCAFLAGHLQQARPPSRQPKSHRHSTGSTALAGHHAQHPQATSMAQAARHPHVTVQLPHPTSTALAAQHPHATSTAQAAQHLHTTAQHPHPSSQAQHAPIATQRSPYCPSRLRSLSMKYCHYLSQTSMRQVARCTGLKQLAMSRWVDASALEEFLDRCLMVTNSALSSLVSKLPKLQSLSVSGCLITSIALLHATWNARGTAATANEDHLSCLQVLNLTRCSNFGTNLKQGTEAEEATPLLPFLPSLHVLSLGGTAILNDHLSQLVLQVPNLRSIHLGSDFELTDSGLAALSSLSELTELTFGNLNISRPPGPDNTAWGGPLNRTTRPPGPDNTPWGGAGRMSSPCFPKLKSLYFGGTFINRGMAHVFPLPCALEELTIQSFGALRDHQMELFARQVTLKVLKLAGGYQLTTEGLLSLKPLSQLRELVVVCCPHITPDEARLLLAQTSRRLRDRLIGAGSAENASALGWHASN
eukprot:gene15930-22064_t